MNLSNAKAAAEESNTKVFSQIEDIKKKETEIFNNIDKIGDAKFAVKLLEARTQARCERQQMEIVLNEEQCTNASQMYNCKQVLFRKRRLHQKLQDDQRDFRNLETKKNW